LDSLQIATLILCRSGAGTVKDRVCPSLTLATKPPTSSCPIKMAIRSSSPRSRARRSYCFFIPAPTRRSTASTRLHHCGGVVAKVQHERDVRDELEPYGRPRLL